jgi:small subunit ribosomal protein S2
VFVGTKKQAQENIGLAAQSCGMPYVNLRWLGGTLTNFRTIRQRMDYLQNLEARYERGDFQGLSKKETLRLEREIARLRERLGGIRELRKLPDFIFVVDVRREEIAVKEARSLGIPIIAMVDTNCDPTPIDIVIPSNDDAIRAIKLISEKVAACIQEGRQAWEATQGKEEVPAEAVGAAGWRVYGEAETLESGYAPEGGAEAKQE